jgi:uridine phosphorylase
MKQPHIQLDSSIGVKYAILPGDPARIDKIIPFLTDVKEETFNREYRSVTGFYKGTKILCMSTGMGGVSASIAIEELKNIGIEAAIRIGSCGTLQPNIKVGDIIISTGCVRDDGTSHSYIRASYPAVPDTDLLIACIKAATAANVPHHIGITRSHETFYAEAEIAQEPYWQKQGVLGDDMETAPIFVVGRLRGMKCASILNNVVAFDGDSAESVADYASGESLSAIGEKNEILVALEALVSL